MAPIMQYSAIHRKYDVTLARHFTLSANDVPLLLLSAYKVKLRILYALNI